METLQSMLGEENTQLAPAVRCGHCHDGKSCEGEVAESWVWNYGTTYQKRPTCFVEDVAWHLVDSLNRRHDPFKGVWLIHDDNPTSVKKGILTFTVQIGPNDQYHQKELDRVEIRVRLKLKRHPLRWIWSKLFKGTPPHEH